MVPDTPNYTRRGRPTNPGLSTLCRGTSVCVRYGVKGVDIGPIFLSETRSLNKVSLLTH